MNWLLILVVIFFLVGFISGMIRGGIKIAVSLAATAVTVVLVFFLTPYVSKGICAYTPVDDAVESKVLDSMSSMVVSSGLREMGVNEDTIQERLEAAGISEMALNHAGITITDILAGRITEEQLSENGIPTDLLDFEEGEETLPRQVQMEAIQNAQIPKVFKNLLSEHNNADIYEILGVNTFSEYVAKYLTKIFINIIAFLATFVVITILIRAIIFALDIIAELPVLGWTNRMIGAGMGVFMSLVIVNFILVGITLLFQTEAGKHMFALIQSSSFLSFLYEHNFIMHLATIFR